MLLTFDFKTVEEAQEFLADLIAGRPRAGSAKEPAVVVPAAEPAVGSAKGDLEEDCGTSPVPAVEKKKPGRPKKTAPAKEKEYGIEDCRAALSALFDVKGRDAAKAALAEFKVARIGELKSEQYRGFVVMCEDLSQPE